MRRFKVGDKVMLDPKKCTQEDLMAMGSNGKYGVIYTIKQIDTDPTDKIPIDLEGSNWHSPLWLMYAKKIFLGGE